MKKNKKTCYSPFVLRFEGKNNICLCNYLNNEVIIISKEQEEDIKTIKALRKKKFIIKTKYSWPHKYYSQKKYDWKERFEEQYFINVFIDNLTIKITGKCNNNCEICSKNTNICKCFRDNYKMSSTIISKIIKNFEYIKIANLKIYGGDIFLEKEKLEKLIDKIETQLITLYMEKTQFQENKKYIELLIKKYKNIKLYIFKNRNNKKTIEPVYSPSNYPKSLFFHPCLGNSLAINTKGEIKPSLWIDDILGNIIRDDVLKMIKKGIFNKYWYLIKDKINVCKECELKYICFDCVALNLGEKFSINEKNIACKHNIE